MIRRKDGTLFYLAGFTNGRASNGHLIDGDAPTAICLCFLLEPQHLIFE